MPDPAAPLLRDVSAPAEPSPAPAPRDPLVDEWLAMPGESHQEDAWVDVPLPPMHRWYSLVFQCVPALRQLRRGSEAARLEWLGYYRNRYLALGPDPVLFKSLLVRNGCWNLASPYPMGALRAHEFHPQGLFLADLDFLMERWSALRLGGPKTGPATPLFEAALPANHEQASEADRAAQDDAHNPYLDVSQEDLKPQTIERHQALSQRALDVAQARWALGAAACLRHLFLDSPKEWAWLIPLLHADNRLVLATLLLEALPKLDGHAPHDGQRLLDQWQTAHWLTPVQATRLAEAFPAG